MPIRPAVPLAALALLTACAGFMDDRQLPMLPMTSRAALGEQQVLVDYRMFTLRSYAETRTGMGQVTAFYVLGPEPARPARRLANGVEVYSGHINNQPVFSNFPGEWYCGQSPAACVQALQEPIPLKVPFPP